MPDCTLCHLTRGVILENEHWTLVLNENQATLGRVFFALKRHETDITTLTPEELTSLWTFLSETKLALTALFAPDHFNYMFLMNLTPHVHMHIFPRYQHPREYLDQLWTDSHFGDHYDPNETRLISDAACDALTAVLRHEIMQPTGAAL